MSHQKGKPEEAKTLFLQEYENKPYQSRLSITLEDDGALLLMQEQRMDTQVHAVNPAQYQGVQIRQLRAPQLPEPMIEITVTRHGTFGGEAYEKQARAVVEPAALELALGGLGHKGHISPIVPDIEAAGSAALRFYRQQAHDIHTTIAVQEAVGQHLKEIEVTLPNEALDKLLEIHADKAEQMYQRHVARPVPTAEMTRTLAEMQPIREYGDGETLRSTHITLEESVLQLKQVRPLRSDEGALVAMETTTILLQPLNEYEKRYLPEGCDTNILLTRERVYPADAFDDQARTHITSACADISMSVLDRMMHLPATENGAGRIMEVERRGTVSHLSYRENEKGEAELSLRVYDRGEVQNPNIKPEMASVSVSAEELETMVALYGQEHPKMLATRNRRDEEMVEAALMDEREQGDGLEMGR